MTRLYDNYRPDQQLLLDLQLREGNGTAAADWAKPYRNPATLVNAPTWSFLGGDLTYLSLDCADHEHLILSAADTADLDFTTEAFSGALWFYPDASGYRYFFNKGTASTGWAFILQATTYDLIFMTRQAGPTNQYSVGSPCTISTWQMVGFTRSGEGARLFLNGRDVTTDPGTHVDPASSAAENFYIGCNDLVAAGWLCGGVWRPRVWGRQLAAWEMLALFEAERSLFGA